MDRIDSQRWLRFALENPAGYCKPYSYIHQVESFHKHPHITTTAGVRQFVELKVARARRDDNGSNVLDGSPNVALR